jgi:hypothetical protein
MFVQSYYSLDQAQVCLFSCQQRFSDVNFSNILRADFAPIFLPKKVQTLIVSTKKAACKTFARKTMRKVLVKSTPGRRY